MGGSYSGLGPYPYSYQEWVFEEVSYEDRISSRSLPASQLENWVGEPVITRITKSIKETIADPDAQANMLADFWSDMNMLFRGGDDPACPRSVRRGVYVRLPDTADAALQNEMMGEAEADSIEQHFARVASTAAATPTTRPSWPIISAYHRWVTSAAAQKYNNTNAEHGCGVAVDPEYRGGGLGPELCRRLIRKARESIIARAHGGQAAVGSSGEISAGDVDAVHVEQDAPLDAPTAPMYFVVELINDAGYTTFDKIADEFDIEIVFETQLGDTGEWLRVIEIMV